ncbi:hypothetical protein G6F37_010969 [Rhizopus arrhizus]|nr:hypothetical protein G6F38_011102 [Rhizopus arrhizus]KAG1151544.1 hypothetical protein G6F37_010969 [Rhizopus arrhizus]
MKPENTGLGGCSGGYIVTGDNFDNPYFACMRNPDAVWPNIKALFEEDASHRSIAKSLGLGVGSVSRICKEFVISTSNVAGQPKKILTLLSRKIFRSFNTGKYTNAVDASKKLEAEGTPPQPSNYQDQPFGVGRQAVDLDTGWAALEIHNVNMVYKHGGGSIFLWSCITHQGPGFIVKIDEGLDAALYCEILSDDFLNTLEEDGLKKEDIVFQQDNDSCLRLTFINVNYNQLLFYNNPKHTYKLARKWFEDNGIEAMDWPAYSSDLNPIENTWLYLKTQLCAYETEPKDMTELWEHVQYIWCNKITKKYCQKLIRIMTQRLETVIKAKVGHTKW